MKKIILPLLISLIPIFLNAQPLNCDIQINGVPASSLELCTGDDQQITCVPSGGTAPYSYLWSGYNPNTINNNTIANPVITATNAGNYTVVCTVTDALSNTCVCQITLTVNSLPSLITNSNVIICLGECTNLGAMTGFGGDGLVWYEGFIGGPIDTSCTGCLTLVTNVCPTTTTDYYAMAVISPTGCIKTRKVTVTVIDLTVTVTGTPNPICLNDTSCLTATPLGGIGPYSYDWSPTNQMDDPASGTPCVWPPTNTNYCVTVTDDASGCTASACFMVTVNPQQPPVIASDTTICYGACVDLTASGSGTIFDWSTLQMNVATINVCPTSTTVYTVTMTDANGCTASDDVVVTVNPQLFANAGPDQFICYDDSVQIGGTPTGSWGSAPYTYSWSPAAGLSSTTASNPWASPTATTTFCVTVTDAAGCTATDCAIVTVNPQIIIDPGNPPPLCLGACAVLGGSPTVTGGTPPYTYNWNPAATLDDATIANPTACPLSTTLYNLTVTDAAGCTETASVTVIVNQNPVATAAADQTICSGESIDIGGSPTASGGTSPYGYNWTAVPADPTLTGQETTSNPNVSPLVTTTYCVTVTDASGCTASDCVTITVNPSPTADAGTDVTVCQGICVAIGGAPTATGGTPPYTYQWNPSGSLNPNGTVPNPTACPLTTTTYCVTVTDALGCTATDCVTITVNTATATAVANPSTICLGECSDITATGGGTYLWSTGLTTATINVCPVVTTTYTVTVTATNGCTAAASATVTVISINLTATPTTNPICPPACTDITANPSGGTAPYTFQWSTGGLTQVINVCPVATTTYTVTATDANGCTQTASTTVNVMTATATATPPTICNGGCTTISATGGGSYSWSSGQNTASFVVCPTVNTTYTVTVVNGGCTMTASVTVNVTTISAMAVPATSPICQGQCTNITATGSGGTLPYTYSWDTGGTTQVINVCPASTTTYTCTITDANGCTGTANATVTVVAANITGSPTSICAGGTAQLIATGGGTYQWCCGLGTNDTVSVSPASTTTYTVTVTNSGCTASAEFTVIVSILTVNATASPTTVCAGAGTPVTLGASLGTSYSWVSSPVDGTLAGQTTLQNPVVVPTQTTTYTVTVTNSGCSASASVTVTVDNVSANISAAPNTVCSGDCSTISVMVTSGNPPYTYLWNTTPALTTQIINVCPTSTTTYTCTITDATGCTDIVSVTITTLPLPVAVITPNPVSICAGGTATLTASGGCSYIWSTGEVTATINPSPLTTTTYTVTVTNCGNTCTASASAVVNVTSAPVANISIIPPSASICSGECATLTASGGSNYLWSTGATTPSIIECPPVTTTYTVTVSQSGCTAISLASATITVTPTPTVSLTSSAAPSNVICSGTCVTFTALPSGALDYNFIVNGSSMQSGGLNTFNTCTLTNPSTVIVVASNGAGCDDTSSVINITVNPSPTVSVSGTNPSICGACDGSMLANPSGGTPGYGYEWNTIPPQFTQLVTGICAGNYCVTVTDANLCEAVICDNLSDPGAPLITLSSDDADNTICSNDCVTFTASGTAVNFTFYVSSQSPTNVQGPGPLNTYNSCSLVDGDQVTVEGTDAFGCSGFSSIITMDVDPLPLQFNITGGGPFCNGSGGVPIGLNGSELGVTYYLYDSGGALLSMPGTGGPIDFPPQAVPDTYYIIGQNDLTTCQNNMLGTVPVSENPLPTLFSVTGGGSFCADGTGITVGLSGSQILSDSVSYQLYIDGIPDTTIIGNGSAISFGDWTIPGTYTVVATYIETTCEATMNGSAILTAYAVPTQYTVTGGGSYCSGGFGVFIGLSLSDPGVNYELLYNGLPISPTPVQLVGTGFPLNFGVQTAAGSYTVEATNAYCSTGMFNAVTVTVNPLPAANAGLDATICEGSFTTLSATGAGVNGTYEWDNSTGTLSSDTIDNPIATPVSTTIYSVTVTDINGCTDNDDVTVTVLPFTYPTTTVTDTGFCTGDPITSTICVVPATYASYSWNTVPVQTTSCITVTVIGCYSVVVTAANGCSAVSADVCLEMYPPIPNAVIIPGGPTTFCEPDSVELHLNNPYYMFEWSSGSINTPSIFVTETGAYYVTVTDSFGCKDTAGPQNVTVDPLPHAIISYVDNDNTALTFDFYSNSLYSSWYSWNFGDVASVSNTSLAENPSHNFTSVNSYTVTLVVSNDCGSDTAIVTIVAHQPYSGLSENSGIFDFDLYPNPAKDLINMDFSLSDAGTVAFIMYDALGQELVIDESSYMSGEQHKEINLSELSKGVYILKVSTDKGSFIRRVVKD